MIEILLVSVAALFLSVWLTGMVRKLAVAHGVLDVPNERSSHGRPTPRGGGVAIVAAATAAAVVLALIGVVDSRLLVALGGGGTAVAIVGFVDDRHKLSAKVRIAVHVAAALWAIAWLGGLPPIRVGGEVVSFGWSGYVVGALGIAWTLNLFNFMDGIDGIAAAEAAFVAVCGALLGLVAGTAAEATALGFVLGAASLGFLWWNWSPARIFMGDVGSGYLGYVIAVLAMAAARDNPVALLTWLILGGAFFVDATYTLGRRLARRERLHEAHRSHAYQRLARRWQSHRRVTVAVILVNLLWLFPCALVATLYPQWAAWMVIGALAPLGGLAFAVGAGHRETETP